MPIRGYFACAITGVLMISLPMTVVVEIFTNFYKHLNAKSKLPNKLQRRHVLNVKSTRTRKFSN